MQQNGPNGVEQYDVAVVGGGPIGIEMAIALKRAGIDHILFEAKQIGQAITRWPAHTHFYSTPEHVALAGMPVHNLDQQPITGEQYLAYLRTLVEFFDLNLHNYEAVETVKKIEGGFQLKTSTLAGENVYRCEQLILATGGMASPRLMEIPGEELPHVYHYFPGPHQFFRTRLLVVGGKNSALEAALRCWRAGAEVTLSYRRPQLDYEVVKPHLADDISTRLEKKEIQFLPNTVPVAITPQHTVLARTGPDFQPGSETFCHESDFVLLATGFVADMALFRTAGVTLQGKRQVPLYDPETMETNVPGLYVAGTAAGGTQIKFETFISTSHDHVARIMQSLTGRAPGPLGTVDARNNAVTWEEVKAN
jgi:thioredoxin reductase (NADPH)